MWRIGFKVILSLTLGLTLLLTLTPSIAQTARVHGYVTEAVSGEALPGASIYDSLSRRGTTTNNYGYFNLLVNKGPVSLSISYTGYRKQRLQLSLQRDTLLNIGLSSQVLGEIVIEESASRDTEVGVTKIPVARMEKIPMLAGEPDILKSLAFTPGVSTGTEGTAGLYVRGGTPDQNLILLDDAPVYNAFHLFGFSSVFNTDAIKDVKLIKGGFPARYGGRLSSIIDITMKEGNNKKLEGEAGIGLIGSRFSIGGPIVKDRASFFLGARASYLTLFLLPTYRNYKQGRADTYFNYSLYDVNAKFNYQVDNNSQVFVSFYTGDDFYRAEEGMADNHSLFHLRWGNQTASVRYRRTFSPSLFGKVILLRSGYFYKISGGVEHAADTDAEDIFFRSRSGVVDWTGKFAFEWIPLRDHEIEFGAEGTLHLYTPGIFSSSFTAIDAANQKFIGREYALFAEDVWTVANRLKLQAGLRLSFFNIQQKTYSGTEPRVSAQYKISERFSVNAAYSKMRQYVHLLSGNSGGLANDIWVPATRLVPPQTAQQWSIGTQSRFRNSVSISAEGFYKELADVIDYQPGSNFLLSVDGDFQEMIDTGGRGLAYGGELMIEKSAGRFSWLSAYTLSWNKRKFESISDGKWYPSKYDRRHNFSFTSLYKVNDHWAMSGTWVYSSGHPVTLPVAVITDLDGNRLPVYKERNNSRMPAYHRLDIGFQKTWKTRRSREATLSFGLYNVYNRVNPFYVDYSIDRFGPNPLKAVSKRVGAFPILPYISYSIKF